MRRIVVPATIFLALFAVTVTTVISVPAAQPQATAANANETVDMYKHAA